MGNKHFANFYEEPERTNIVKIVEVTSFFARILSEEDDQLLYEEVSKDEPLSILSSFHKDNNLGLDGCTMKFFLGLFQSMGDDLLQVVEEASTEGKVLGYFNSTFLALIPNVDNLESFDDLRAIAMCVCV